MSAISALREATWSSHQRLEKRLDVKARFSDRDRYRGHLERMWGFCAVLEQRVAEPGFGGALGDYPSRLKLPLLTRDLIALGSDAAQVACIARCDAIARCADPAAAFGTAYVMEGATLGGRTMLPIVEARLGLNADRGGSFLASYGGAVGAKWRTFGTALDEWCSTPARQTSASAAAVATFDALADWLCNPT